MSDYSEGDVMLLMKGLDKAAAQCAELSRENERLRAALEFYANPESYFAIAFLPDRPCGEFIEDFSDDHGDVRLRGYRPGKRAREALDWKEARDERT